MSYKQCTGQSMYITLRMSSWRCSSSKILLRSSSEMLNAAPAPGADARSAAALNWLIADVMPTDGLQTHNTLSAITLHLLTLICITIIHQNAQQKQYRSKTSVWIQASSKTDVILSPLLVRLLTPMICAISSNCDWRAYVAKDVWWLRYWELHCVSKKGPNFETV